MTMTLYEYFQQKNFERAGLAELSLATGCLQKTVTSNISLTDLKITKNGVTQSFLESLYLTIYASSTCLAVWATLGHFGPLWLFGPLWATLGHFGPFKHETG